MNTRNLIIKLKDSKLFRDSFWSVFGNGVGSALLLLAGIIIARFLGKDLYGEYGVVKTTMFYAASFATLGLGFTSTKYVAEYIRKSPQYVKCIVRDGMLITLCTSSLMAAMLIIFSNPLARYLNEPGLSLAFKMLGCIIVFRALVTTQGGILSGFKSFKEVARNSFYSGVFMLIICVPLTYYWGLKGALTSLLLSQCFNFLINFRLVNRTVQKLQNQQARSFKKELVIFSFPVALQESSYSICNWIGMMILVKLSSAGELGIYSVTQQWAAIILFIPGMLYNVVLSHLSTHTDDADIQNRTMNIMLLTNFVSTFIPATLVYIFSGFVSSFYGDTFAGMKSVLNIMVFGTVFTCCANVFRAEFVSLGKNWLMLWIRLPKDAIFLLAAYYLIYNSGGKDGAYYYAIASLAISVFYLAILLICYLKYYHNATK